MGIQNLRVKDIQDIYSGRVTDWSDVRGNKGKISLLSRNPGSGTRRAFERFVFTEQYGTITSVLSTEDMYSAVIDTPGAIGYVDLKTAQERSSKGKATIVTIEGQEASTQNAAQKQYSFCAMEYLFKLRDPGSLVTSFIKQVKTKVAEDPSHYVPYDNLSSSLQEKYQ